MAFLVLWLPDSDLSGHASVIQAPSRSYPCPVTALHASCPLQHLSLPVIHAQGLQYPAVYSPDAPPLDMAVLFPLWRPLCSQGREKFPASVHPYASVASLDPGAAPCHPQYFCIKKTGLYLIHNRLADLFYDNPSSILWYTVTFLFLLRLPIHAEKAKSLIVSLCSLTMGIFILHPILLAGIQAVYTPAGTFSAVALWLFLTVLSGAITFVIGKIPLVNLLIRT